jgi:hypothetical protein
MRHERAPFVGSPRQRQPPAAPVLQRTDGLPMPAAMSDAALDHALARLDRAIARLEQAAPARHTDQHGIAEAYAQLGERHGALRLRVQETIERLDALIAGEAQG